RVALKVIKLGMDTKQVIARFEIERQALAMMNHPNVARVLDAGATEDGRPYFVMEHVAGVSITEYCDKHRLSTVERLQLFMQVCHAVQHAHQKAIIHRDIKPSNVLVAVQDGKPVPKVIDFGVAKATEHRLTEKTLFTEQGQLIGTPEYMSPEQAEMSALDIDTRTDIYSLGVVLYELLVGALPFDRLSLRRAALGEIQRIIREEEPQKPSTKLSSLRAPSTARTPDSEPRPSGSAQSEPRPSGSGQSEPVAQAPGVAAPSSQRGPLPHGRGSDRGRGTVDERMPANARSSIDEIARHRRTDPASLIKRLRGDLDWIIMKAMDKDRTRRYATASELADDIARHLRHEPVVASPPSTAYRLKKFLHRNKGPVGAVAAVIVALTAGVVTATYLYSRAEDEKERAVNAEALAQRRLDDAEEARDDAEEARDDADAVTDFLTEWLSSVDPEKQGIDITLREMLDQAGENIGEKFADRPLIEARLRHTIGWTYVGLGLYDKAQGYLADAAALYRREKGPRHPRTLAVLNSLAAVLRFRGDYTAAAARHKATLEIQRRVLGEEHPDTLASMGNLANALHEQGQYAQAEELLRKVLDIQRRVLGEEHSETLKSMNNLANALNGQGQYPQAEELYRKVLDIQRRVLGEEHPDTLRSMNNLAIALRAQGQYAQAEELYRKVLDIQRRVLGEEHPETLALMGNLAFALWSQGQYAQAEELNRKVLDIRRRVLGEEHPATLASMNNLALALDDQGQYAQAEELNRKVLDIRRRVLGEEHPHTLSSMNNLANALDEQGQHAQGEELHRKVLDIRRRVLGEEHPRTLRSMNNLAVALDAQGQYAQAEDLHRNTLDIRRRVLGEEHPDTLNSMDGLLTVLNAQDKLEEARTYASALIELRRQRAEKPQATPSDLNSYASLLLTCEPADLRDPGTALPLAIKAVEKTGARSFSTLGTLALAYQMTGDIDQAVETQREALALLPPDPMPQRTEL
ncbi:MAG: tetratricopeptide repeat protein, partial [Armatimonadetes bacterium]|nr:tetratricopeptide repeat protein [Armatimonadota bacterium]